ncbi:MAG: DUF1806 family protein [Bacilli bacterium]
MKKINPIDVEQQLQKLHGETVYVHLETTTGAYAAHHGNASMSVCALIRNIPISFRYGSIQGKGPYTVGLNIEDGWVYAEGLTHMTQWPHGMSLAGIDSDGKLAICLQLSTKKFGTGEERDWT